MAVIKFEVKVDDKEAAAKLQNLDNSLRSVESSNKAVTSAGTQTEGRFASLGAGVLKTAAALGIGYAGFRSLKSGISSMIDAAIEGENAANNLRVALESTGRITPGLTESMLEFSSAVQRETIINDEAVTSIQTLMAQMTKLDVEGIQRATKGAIGLARTLNIDVNSAALLVQKAMEGNFGALSRYGIKVDETLSKQEKQAELLNKLEALYVRAQEETNTYGGILAQLKNVWSDMLEAMGYGITESEGLRSALGGIKNLVIALTPTISEFTASLGDLIGGVVNFAVKAVEVVEDLKKRISGLTSSVSKSEKDWQHLTESLGGFSEISRLVQSRMLATGSSFEETGKLSELLLDSWNELNGSTIELAKNLALGKYGEAAQKAFMDILTSGGGAVEILKELNKQTLELELDMAGLSMATTEMSEADKAAAKAKDELLKRIKEMEDAADPAAARMREWNSVMADTYLAAMQGTIGFENLISVSIALGKLRPLEPMIDSLSIIPTQIEAITSSVGAMIAGLEPQIKSLEPQGRWIALSWTEQLQNFGESSHEIIAKIQGAWADMYSFIGGISSQYQKNEDIRLNNEYKKRLDIIKKSTKSEEEKQKAIEALDAEYDIKRQAIQRTAAKQQKAASLVQATINVAEAITKALAQGGIFGKLMAIPIAALGAAQIKLIASQPLPLATGAVFDRPTEFYTPAGQKVLMGEAGTEILLPEKKLREIIRSEGGGGGAINVQIPIEVAFGSVAIRKEVVAVINQAGKRGDIKLPAERVLV